MDCPHQASVEMRFVSKHFGFSETFHPQVVIFLRTSYSASRVRREGFLGGSRAALHHAVRSGDNDVHPSLPCEREQGWGVDGRGQGAGSAARGGESCSGGVSRRAAVQGHGADGSVSSQALPTLMLYFLTSS